MHRHQWYQALFEKIPAIEREARDYGESLGLARFAGAIALYSGMSSSPAPLPGHVLDAIVAANRGAIGSVQSIEDDIRSLVKDAYGDAFDCAVVNTCEAGLRVAIETLIAPPVLRRGEARRAAMLFPYGEDCDWGAAYGRAFPPKYKNAAIDRSVSAGELGMEAKCLSDLETLFVPFANARYEVHGIRQNIVPFLLAADGEATTAAMERMAERHGASVAGLHAIGYDTPGYGYHERDAHERPMLMRRFGDLARRYDVPFIVDSASALPIVGSGPDDFNADVQLWSLDKIARAPTAGLIVGREDALLPIRKALGLAGERFGNVSSHGKAVFSAFDPGRTALAGVLAALKVLHEEPERIRRPVDELHDIVSRHFASMDRFAGDFVVTKSYHLGGTEVNYLRTWDHGRKGIPIFTLEDLYAQTNPIARALSAMGVQPPPIYAGNMTITPGTGLIDDGGGLDADAAELAVRALVRSIEIVCRHAGL
ncbi:MAG: hypothetical protein AB7S92_09005 [Parvibaculaceae bacterium]